LGYLDIATDLFKKSEKCRLVGYLDVAGHPTWGYGHTGPEVKVGEAITQDLADQDCRRDMAIANKRVTDVVKPDRWASLSDHQKAALVDFAGNAGFDPKWQIAADLNAGALADVPTQLHRFDHARIKGQLVVVPGLDNRRMAEVIVWNTGDTTLAGQIAKSGAVPPSSGYLVGADTPPAPTPRKPFAKTALGIKLGTIGTGAVTFIGTNLPGAADKAAQAHDLVSAHASELGHFGPAIVSVLGAAIVVLGLAGIVIHDMQNHAAKV
jgi:lysozyme